MPKTILKDAYQARFVHFFKVQNPKKMFFVNDFFLEGVFSGLENLLIYLVVHNMKKYRVGSSRFVRSIPILF